LALLAGAASAAAQDKKDPPPKPPPIDPNAVEVRFADGSAVKMTMLHSSVEVVTKYGKLTVPSHEVRRIEFGMRFPEGVQKRIDEGIDGLGSNVFKTRDAAAKDLLALGEYALPAVQRAAKGTDPEVVRRATDLLKQLKDRVPPERQKPRTHDLIQTADFAIVGRIDADALKAKTQYFGEVSLKLAELRGIRWLSGQAETDVSVDAAKYAMQNEVWLDTGIEIRANSDVVITAAGTIDLYPNSGQPGMYNSTPAGNRQWNNGRGAWPPGQLLGRIGETGTLFVVGEKYTGTPTQDGRLYLRISGSPWGQCSGSYSVKVVSEAVGAP
jgi:hypothetical protein